MNTASENLERNYRSSMFFTFMAGDTLHGSVTSPRSTATMGSEGPITMNSSVDTDIAVRKLERCRMGQGTHCQVEAQVGGDKCQMRGPDLRYSAVITLNQGKFAF